MFFSSSTTRLSLLLLQDITFLITSKTILNNNLHSRCTWLITDINGNDSFVSLHMMEAEYWDKSIILKNAHDSKTIKTF